MKVLIRLEARVHRTPQSGFCPDRWACASARRTWAIASGGELRLIRAATLISCQTRLAYSFRCEPALFGFLSGACRFARLSRSRGRKASEFRLTASRMSASATVNGIIVTRCATASRVRSSPRDPEESR